MPRRSISLEICGPAPWTTTVRAPASASASRTEAAATRPPSFRTTSRRVLRVEPDVVVREVGGEVGGFSRSRGRGRARSCRPRPPSCGTRPGGRAALEDGGPVERDGQQVRVEMREAAVRRRRAGRGEHPAPVRVVPEGGGLDERRRGDAAARSPARPPPVELAPETRISRTTVAPSPSATIWRERSAQTSRSAAANRASGAASRATPDCAVREQDDGVVRRAVAVDRDAVERLLDGRPEKARRPRPARAGSRWSRPRASSRARDGSSPRPWPSRRRRSRRRRRTAVFGPASVVRIASDAAGPPPGERVAAASSTPLNELLHRQPRSYDARSRGRRPPPARARAAAPCARRSRRRPPRPRGRWPRSPRRR